MQTPTRTQLAEEIKRLADEYGLAKLRHNEFDNSLGVNRTRKDLHEAISALASAEAVQPEGLVLVPKEPTREMYLAACRGYTEWSHRGNWQSDNGFPITRPEWTHNDVYAVMIAAAPSTPNSTPNDPAIAAGRGEGL